MFYHGPRDHQPVELTDWATPRLAALGRGRVLDVGCGDGRFLPPNAIGVDLDFERLRVGRARSPRLVQADAHALPFPDATFDTVFANRMLNAAGRVDAVLREIVRVVRPEGTVVVFTRARRKPEADRLDPENGGARLGAYFTEVIVERAADGALFVATGPRGR